MHGTTRPYETKSERICVIYFSEYMLQTELFFIIETVNSEEEVYKIVPISSSSKSILAIAFKSYLSIQNHLFHLQFHDKFPGDPEDELNHILQEDYVLNQFEQHETSLH